jgi:hypothetical protein
MENRRYYRGIRAPTGTARAFLARRALGFFM